jgi:hypothetical protein
VAQMALPSILVILLLQTLPVSEHEKLFQVAVEMAKVYVPVANRFQCHRWSQLISISYTMNWVIQLKLLKSYKKLSLTIHTTLTQMVLYFIAAVFYASIHEHCDCV